MPVFIDFDLDPMTFILKLDLDVVKMYLYANNEVPSSSGSKIIAWTDRQTETQTETEIDTTKIPFDKNSIMTLSGESKSTFPFWWSKLKLSNILQNALANSPIFSNLDFSHEGWWQAWIEY